MALPRFFRELFGASTYGSGSVGEGVHIRGGSGAMGGDVVIEAGGTNDVSSNGKSGLLFVRNLPTADPWKAGAVWISGDTLTVSVDPDAPVFSAAVGITGTAQDGQTLGSTNGTYDANPTPTFTYQWYADGVAISGATADTYLLTTAEVGKVITLTEIATNVGGSASSTSLPTAAVIAA